MLCPEGYDFDAELILNKLVRRDGRLLASYMNVEAAILGCIGDYAIFINEHIELYHATLKLNI